MIYSVEYTKGALRDLKRLDRQTAALIIGWMRRILSAVQTRARRVRD